MVSTASARKRPEASSPSRTVEARSRAWASETNEALRSLIHLIVRCSLSQRQHHHGVFGLQLVLAAEAAADVVGATAQLVLWPAEQLAQQALETNGFWIEPDSVSRPVAASRRTTTPRGSMELGTRRLLTRSRVTTCAAAASALAVLSASPPARESRDCPARAPATAAARRCRAPAARRRRRAAAHNPRRSAPARRRPGAPSRQ